MTPHNLTITRRSFLKRSGLTLGAISIIPAHVLGGNGRIAPSDKIQLGFIGVGKQGLGLGRRFSELEAAQIIAVCDVDQQKLTRFQKEIEKLYANAKEQPDFKGISIYGDFIELTNNPDIDAVVIATPDHWHAIQSIIAMNAGKDVYCEKPLAHTIEEGRAMVETARKNGKILQTGSMQRSNDSFRKACELVQNGYLGQIERVLVNVGDPAKVCDLASEAVPEYLDWDLWVGPTQMRGYNPIICPPITDNSWAKWRDYKEFGGGILSDWGAHMFDIAQWGLGMDLSGPVQFIPPAETGATRGLQMIYENGIEMIHEDFGRGWGVRFMGSEGTLDISRQYLDSKPGNIAETELKADDIKLYQSENHYSDWLECIKSHQLPICDVETGHRSSSICNLANIAYELKRELTWDPMKEKFSKDREANNLRTKNYRKAWKLKRWA